MEMRPRPTGHLDRIGLSAGLGHLGSPSRFVAVDAVFACWVWDHQRQEIVARPASIRLARRLARRMNRDARRIHHPSLAA